MKNGKNYKNSNNSKGKTKGFKPSMKGMQGKKDSNTKRFNFDNERRSTFIKDVEQDIENGSKGRGANDISDFNKNQDLLKSAGSLPFSTILGTRNLGNGSTSKAAVPGILTYVYAPTYGACDNANLIANKAFQQITSFVVHANSRNTKYEYTDEAMYTIAGIEVFAAIAEAIRAYGIVMHYAEQNEYLCDALLDAIGFNSSDIRKVRGTMWFDINNLIMQTKQIWIPDVMPILQRSIRLNSYVYTDAPGERSQLYIPLRQTYFMLNENANTSGTCLVPALYNVNNAWTPFERMNLTTQTISGTTWEQFKEMIQNMIDVIIAAGDRVDIYGDILKAYGADKIYAMPAISADYTVVPTYNAEVLTQIENITVNNNSYIVGFTQDMISNVKRFLPIWKLENTGENYGTLRGMSTSQVLNMHIADQPTPEAIMIATRFKAGGVNGQVNVKNLGKLNPTVYPAEANYTAIETATSSFAVPETIGSELVVGIFTTRIYTFNGWPTTQNNYMPVNVLDVTEEASLLDLMAFDWHPFIYSIDNSNAGFLKWNMAWGDYDNYIIISDEELRKLNETAAYSLWGVPHV